jgi:hypothetical protein
MQRMKSNRTVLSCCDIPGDGIRMMHMGRWIRTLLILVSVSFSATAWSLGMNDLSVLIPLPGQSDFDRMIHPGFEGGKGQLLPWDTFRFLPVLAVEADPETLYRNHLRVVGIRFDPCFQEGRKAPCRPQIRLVWQPLIFVGDQSSTLDASVHTFYELAPGDWEILISELTGISDGDRRIPLQIHPRILREGHYGPTWSRFRTIIGRFAGESNLIRATAMTVRQGRVWAFMGVDRVPGGWRPIRIPALPGETPVRQSFLLFPEGMMNLAEFKGSISPVATGFEDWQSLVSDSIEFKAKAGLPRLKSLMGRAIEIENPRRHNPGTVDCVSCHMAQTVRLWGQSHFPSWDWERDFESQRYPGRGLAWSNTSVNPSRTDRVRAFGYFGSEPVIAQRVIHETLESLGGYKKTPPVKTERF